MIEAYICDAVRTPFGRYGGALSGVRTDDLAALSIKALMDRNPTVDCRTETRTDGCHRTQRTLRRAGAGRDARTGSC